MKLRENAILIVAFLSVVTFIYLKIKQCVRNYRINKLSRQLYQDVLGDLKNLSGGVNGLSQNDILRKYMEMPLTFNDGLRRDEDAFNKHIWPRIDARRVADK